MRSSTMNPVVKLDFSVREESLEMGARMVLKSIRPNWTEEIQFKIFTDGITNKLIGCSQKNNPNDVVLVRVYGQNTDLLIDRKAEAENFKLLHKSGYAPSLYAIFQNGLAYEFVPGDIITPEMVRAPHIYPLIASMMAKMHSIKHQNTKPCVWDKIELHLKLIPVKYTNEHKQKNFIDNFPLGVEALKQELQFLKNKLCSIQSPVVFCHNDLLLANIIHKNDKVTFIDYEYAACNYQAYDIGNHFAEFAGVTEVNYSLFPDENFQKKWLKVYLQEFKTMKNETNNVTDEEINILYDQVNKFVMASHLYWATWALVQGQHSTIDFDFIGYGGIRMKEYQAQKNNVLQ